MCEFVCRKKHRPSQAVCEAVISLSSEAELDAEVEADKIGAVLVLTSDVDVELARGNLARQSDGLFELVSTSRDRALNVSIVGSCLLADVEATSEEPDEAELDYNVCECAVLSVAEERRVKENECR